MRNLEELRKKVYPIPCLFAKESAESNGAIASLDYSNGFKPIIEQTYIERHDINRFGELASLESHYMQAGGIHSFSTPISDNYSGYPQHCLLYAYDGNYLQKVESTEENNTKPFIDNAGNVIPNVIDCPVIKPNDSNTTPRILWKSVGNVFGTTNGLFSLDLDYSNLQHLSQGSIISSDSLVIGECLAFWSHKDENLLPSALPRLIHSTGISEGMNSWSLSISNKGRYGDNIGIFDIIYIVRIGTAVFIGKVPMSVPYLTGGTGTYALSFFAKAGTSFSGIAQGKFNTAVRGPKYDINWVAIPIKPKVKEPESSEEEANSL